MQLPPPSRARVPAKCSANSTEGAVRLRTPSTPRQTLPDRHSQQDPQDVEGKELLSAPGPSAVLHSAPGVCPFCFPSGISPGQSIPQPCPCLAGRDQLSRTGDFRRGIEVTGTTSTVTISLQSCYSRKREPCSPPVACPELGCAPWPWWHRRMGRVWERKQRKVHG